ncbi:MAG: hypothetical protein A2312_03210 [Candidatus Staskawiczbacteria bacterium RIFOXYB2_FULL_32_9]|uniref:Reverse transcriptase domain-containing protein n=1 Tax=Candidatus Staskawiczbacteria bacterium RIFOXYD1_FULL_32_13 TaxID=1802234 RepID=A0A1G2JMT8_9BACT|nr:MAG: hypothetical protein A2360_02895 [Candidatus Staskawiczbacteria bacterium RIFOXYB1_FULL_32_11]OGZ78518.1 MAG: hypothetical protein A2256_00975 [Candidatus Staskawiczbacteria bacterium RIFOXYA2_FULL_32_7]OGZ81104.1 MAG: hypothetical protein A2312_03210 [Candidatus Staskawiczbacteria bacterium RIFOXYB2_FULL_32_9]OGZ87558.1 MAG: hypothetical protein A2561_00910 [Candidatus Staskawiczbacteria bacterium RIFOXYD1_FULL_32_13]OGZ87953.1 MAG: hypothetical protein A2463_00220 [Candidatus Staskawi
MSGRVLDEHNIFEKIISLENLFSAWREFKKGKTKKLDVLQFELNLEDNIFSLYSKLKNKTYCHSNYTSFCIKDPKLRKIHKAIVEDRVLHHAIFRILYPIFDKYFIFDSCSCRNNKGVHNAINRLNQFVKKNSKNNTRCCYILKCDVKKYFDSIDQEILLGLIKIKIKDKNAMWLIERIVKSFPAGLPLGNITSQLFANIYLNELDQFIKHKLKQKYYIRYCDDFVIMSLNKEYLKSLIFVITNFLENNLKLSLHKGKIIIERHRRGVDFLGYKNFPDYRILRTKTKKRILDKAKEKRGIESLISYLGILKHCKSRKIKIKLLKNYFTI